MDFVDHSTDDSEGDTAAIADLVNFSDVCEKNREGERTLSPGSRLLVRKQSAEDTATSMTENLISLYKL